MPRHTIKVKMDTSAITADFTRCVSIGPDFEFLPNGDEVPARCVFHALHKGIHEDVNGTGWYNYDTDL